MAESKPTLKDVAREVGVSLMTVSMSLRNHPRISVSTRQRVREAAERIGYRPNPETQQLMERVRSHKSGRYTPTIAVMEFHRPEESDYYTEAIVRGAVGRGDELGYKLEKFPVFGKGLTLSRLMRVLRTRSIAGLIVPPLPRGRAHLRLDWDHLAAVSTTGALWRPRLHATTSDFFFNACLAFREVRRMGYRRIGLLLPRDSEERSRHAFSAAYYWHCRAEGILTPPRVMFDGSLPEILRWVRAGRFELIVGNDYVEYDALKHLGVVPSMPYVCLAWRPTHPHIPGVNLRPEKIGRAALDLVDAALRRNEFGIPLHPKTVTVEGSWVEAV
jgi:DNA-binding LacI/PurR family transcriptional regulator